jgi:hypothetical protein
MEKLRFHIGTNEAISALKKPCVIMPLETNVISRTLTKS